MKHPYRYFFNKSVLWFKRSISFLWLFVVAAYFMVLAGNAFYRNYQARQDTDNLKKQLVDIKLEKERLEALVVYYKTDSFKEKELRRTLLMKRPDEKVYALPESSITKSVEDEIASSAGGEKNLPSTLPIWKQWMHYLWTGDRG